MPTNNSTAARNFAGAVFKYWKALLCGAGVLVITTFAQSNSWSIPGWGYILVAALFMIYACYRAFADEFKRREASERPKISLVFDETRPPYVDEKHTGYNSTRILRVKVDHKGGETVTGLEVTIDLYPFDKNPMRLINSEAFKFDLRSGQYQMVDVITQDYTSRQVFFSVSRTVPDRLRDNRITIKANAVHVFSIIVTGDNTASFRRRYKIFTESDGFVHMREVFGESEALTQVIYDD